MLGRDTKKNTKKTRFFEDKPKWVKQKKDKKTSKKTRFFVFFSEKLHFFRFKIEPYFYHFPFLQKTYDVQKPSFYFFCQESCFFKLVTI